VPSAAKAESVEQLKERFDGVQAAVLTEYRGLTVKQISDLRKQLKGAAAEYKVLKNRLAKIAVRGGALDSLAPHLKGPTGIAYTRQDPVAVAKALQAFVRTNPQLTIKVGLVEGNVVAPEALRSLADLPSKDVLRSQIIGAIEGPMSQIVSLLQAPMRELAYVLAERGKGAAAESEAAAEPTVSVADPVAADPMVPAAEPAAADATVSAADPAAADPTVSAADPAATTTA
jgi:large subunit ribosomal protein L10